MEKTDRRGIRVSRLWICLLGLGLLAGSLPVGAQEPDQVILYQDSNFSGAYMRFDTNREVSDMRGFNTGAAGSPSWNDQVSSVKVGQNKRIVLYADINYRGASITLYGESCATASGAYANMPSGWNDKVSSFKVLDNDQPPQGPEPSSMQVAFYEDANYCGAYLKLGLTEVNDLRQYNTGASGTPNWNDRVSSIRVGSEVKVLLYKDINFQNLMGTLSGPSNISNLASKGWNDTISSVKVVPK
jgi:hypothetical protein